MKKQTRPKSKKPSAAAKTRKASASRKNKIRILLIVLLSAIAIGAVTATVYYYHKSAGPVVEKKTLTAKQLRAIHERERKKWVASGKTYAACISYRWDNSGVKSKGVSISVIKNKCGFPVNARAEILHGVPVNVHMNLKTPLYSSKGAVIRPGRSYLDYWYLFNKNLPYSIPALTFSVLPAIN